MIPIESTVEYEFDQTKFEEYLSSSSAKFSSSRKCRKTSSSLKLFKLSNATNEGSRIIVAENTTSNISAHNDSSPVKESWNQSLPALTKRARQRQRQRRARQMAKALEQTDGVRHHADLESRRHRVSQLSQQTITHVSTKPTTDEWTLVKRTRSTLKERIQKRRAKAAHARALLQQRIKGKKETVTKEPLKLCKVWIPKSGVVQNQHSEPVKIPYPQGGDSKRVTLDITLDRSRTIINRPENANKALYPQKETCSPKGTVIPERSYQQTIKFFGNHTDELYYQAGGMNKTRKRSVQDNEFPEVTINMADKGKSTRHSNPDFSLERKVKRMHEGMSSEDELSDTCSAIASDDTISSTGQIREVFTITVDQFAQILQEALAKQREEIRAEMKTEMELAIQQMRELLAQQPQSNQRTESSRHVQNVIDDSDPEVDEVILADTPPNSNNAGGGLTDSPSNDTGGGSMAPLTGGDQTHSPQCPSNEDDDERMKELENKVNTLMTAQEVKKTGIPCPYPREWDSIPYPTKFHLVNFTPFEGKSSPIQHLIYFKSHLSIISGNEALMVRSFVGTLRGPAFDWYRRLKPGSINCWDDMESLFLSNFFDDDTEVSIGTLLDEKQNDGESVDNFIKRFRNKAMNCRDPVTEEFILQTCHNNLSIDVLEALGVVPSKTWKDLKMRGEQAEHFLKRKKAERSQPTTSAIARNATLDTRFQKEYSFEDNEAPAILKYLLANDKIELPPIKDQEEAKRVTDPNYCAYHRRILHPTEICFGLKNKIQALIDSGVITAKQAK